MAIVRSLVVPRCILFALILFPALCAARISVAAPESAGDDDALTRVRDATHAVVHVRAQALPDATSSAVLGEKREGTGIIIGNGGLVLTIGYLIVEADQVELTDHEGKSVSASVAGYDQSTGFAVLRANGALAGSPISLGKSAAVDSPQHLMIATGPDPASLSLAYVVGQRPFAGYWEYAIDKAIFTSPPRTDHSGAALINPSGELVGIGSLLLGDVGVPGMRLPGNMFVPIDLLTPILDELVRNGHAPASRRPWLGINSTEEFGRIRVTRVTAESPAEKAGIVAGDIILSVSSEKVTTLADLYHKIWARGEACKCSAADIPLTVLQGTDIKQIRVRSMDRADFVRTKPAI